MLRSRILCSDRSNGSNFQSTVIIFERIVGSSTMSARFSRHASTRCCICSVLEKYGTKVKAMRRMLRCSVKIRWMVDFGILNCCSSSLTDTGLFSWIMVATVLMFTSVRVVLQMRISKGISSSLRRCSSLVHVHQNELVQLMLIY